jgi:AAA+ superfamily predicted ATPase
MVTKRPTYPIGYSVAGEPPIMRVLHTDASLELYSLSSGPHRQETLLLLRDKPEASLEWCRHLTTGAIKVENILDARKILGFTAGVRLSVLGEYMGGLSYIASEPAELETLLFALIDCVTQRAPDGLFPNLAPFACWRGEDGSINAALPLPEAPSSEAEAVRYLSKIFFTLVSGVKLEPRATTIPPLSQWCRGAGGNLSQAIAKVLNNESGKRGIDSFAQLSTVLGRPETSDLTEDWLSRKSNASTSVGRAGLDKVAGMHELKNLLRTEVVEPVRNPEPYQKYGLSIPNGILLYGPPGCGKTYIARALSEELGHHFLEIVPSELASPYVHGSVIRIRELFDEAAEHAPSVVFIDEFEALVPVRSGLGGFQHHKAEEVNEILTHLNASADKRVFIIAATNQPDMIDPAVRRTGRLDKLIYVGPPDAEARKDMLLLHLWNRPLNDEFDAEQIANQLQGYSASDLKFLVDEAARDALQKRTPISAESFQRAMMRIVASIPPESEMQYQTIAQRGL